MKFKYAIPYSLISCNYKELSDGCYLAWEIMPFQLFWMILLHYIRMYVSADSVSTETTGFLSSLLGVGCECQGYQLRLVGHSLGGAVVTLLGIRVSIYYLIVRFIYTISLDEILSSMTISGACLH